MLSFVLALLLDCKTVRIFAYSSTREAARAVKQKVWNEAENRERDWGEILTPRFTDFFTDFEKKTDCFAVYLIIIGCIKKNANNNICLYAA